MVLQKLGDCEPQSFCPASEEGEQQEDSAGLMGGKSPQVASARKGSTLFSEVSRLTGWLVPHKSDL